MKFSGLLNEFRIRNGLSQTELANSCDLSKSYISKLESGKRRPPKREIVEKLSENLSLSDAEKQSFYYYAGLIPPTFNQQEINQAFTIYSSIKTLVPITDMDIDSLLASFTKYLDDTNAR